MGNMLLLQWLQSKEGDISVSSHVENNTRASSIHVGSSQLKKYYSGSSQPQGNGASATGSNKDSN